MSYKRAFWASTIALVVWVGLKRRKNKGDTWAKNDPLDTACFL